MFFCAYVCYVYRLKREYLLQDTMTLYRVLEVASRRTSERETMVVRRSECLLGARNAGKDRSERQNTISMLHAHRP